MQIEAASSTPRLSESALDRALGAFARLLGALCGPTVVPLPLAFLVRGARGAAASWNDLILLILCVGVLPAALVLYAYLRGIVDDLDVSLRQQRDRLVIAAAVSCALGALVVAWRGADPVIVSIAVGGALQASILAAVTQVDKISYHAAGVAGLTAVGWALGGLATGLPLVVLSLVTGWSRWYLGRHSWRQIGLGFASGSVVFVAAGLGAIS
jgi:hypothetical protein